MASSARTEPAPSDALGLVPELSRQRPRGLQTPPSRINEGGMPLPGLAAAPDDQFIEVLRRLDGQGLGGIVLKTHSGSRAGARRDPVPTG
jgi:hypothetical protein